MSNPGHRPTRVAIKKLRSEKKRQEKVLNAKLRATGQVPHSPTALPNRGSALATVAEEKEAREDAVSKQFRVLRKDLPPLLAQLEQIPDPRDPRKRRHKLTSLLLYGLLMFVFQFASRRETNRVMRLAHVFNTLARFTRQLRDLYRQFGVRGAIAFIRNSCAAPWLDPARMRVLLAEPFLLQL